MLKKISKYALYAFWYFWKRFVIISLSFDPHIVIIQIVYKHFRTCFSFDPSCPRKICLEILDFYMLEPKFHLVYVELLSFSIFLLIIYLLWWQHHGISANWFVNNSCYMSFLSPSRYYACHYLYYNTLNLLLLSV